MMWLFEHTSKFPRHERFRLAKQIDDALFAFHDALLRASDAAHATEHLREADFQLNKLRTYLRLAVEMKYTTPKQFQHTAEHTSELGRLLGGWLKKASSG